MKIEHQLMKGIDIKMFQMFDLKNPFGRDGILINDFCKQMGYKIPS
jgi:hypothetical protein